MPTRISGFWTISSLFRLNPNAPSPIATTGEKAFKGDGRRSKDVKNLIKNPEHILPKLCLTWLGTVCGRKNEKNRKQITRKYLPRCALMSKLRNQNKPSWQNYLSQEKKVNRKWFSSPEGSVNSSCLSFQLEKKNINQSPHVNRICFSFFESNSSKQTSHGLGWLQPTQTGIRRSYGFLS